MLNSHNYCYTNISKEILIIKIRKHVFYDKIFIINYGLIDFNCAGFGVNYFIVNLSKEYSLNFSLEHIS